MFIFVFIYVFIYVFIFGIGFRCSRNPFPLYKKSILQKSRNPFPLYKKSILQKNRNPFCKKNEIHFAKKTKSIYVFLQNGDTSFVTMEYIFAFIFVFIFGIGVTILLFAFNNFAKGVFVYTAVYMEFQRGNFEDISRFGYCSIKEPSPRLLYQKKHRSK